MQTLIASIIVFGVIIFVHELGHFIAARRSGIKVLELALGFGPKIFGWSRDGTDYSLRAVPFGGFCRMLGEDDPEEKDHPDSFARKPLLNRIAVVAAGSIMNFLLAIMLLFSVYFFFLGVPEENSTKIGSVIDERPAAEAGIKEGDELKSIDGVTVNNWSEVVSQIESKAGVPITIELLRNGERELLTVTPLSEDTPDGSRGVIGITSHFAKYRLGASFGMAFDYIAFILTALYQTFTGQIPLDVVGPVGIIGFVGEAASMGIVNLIMLTALISFSLGFMNLLPIPALDGGRLIFLFIEGIRGKPLAPEKEGMIHMIGFAALILLIIVVTYNDLLRMDIIR